MFQTIAFISEFKAAMLLDLGAFELGVQGYDRAVLIQHHLKHLTRLLFLLLLLYFNFVVKL